MAGNLYKKGESMTAPNKTFIKGVLCITLAALFALAGPKPVFCQDSLEVRVGLYDFKPLAFMDTDGKAKGFFIDILEDMAIQEKWSVTYVFSDFNQCLARLKNGEIDLIAGVAYSDERAKEFAFTSEPLFIIWAEIYTPGHSPIKTVMDLKDKTISVVKGAQVNRELKALLDGFGISAHFGEQKDYDAVLKSLETSSSDAGVFSNLYGFGILGSHSVERTHIFFAPTKLKFALRKEEGQKSKSGVSPEILDRYFLKYQADPGSIYYRSYGKWIEPTGMPMPSPAKIKVPVWVYGLFIALVVFSLILVVFNRLLNRMVKVKIRELNESSERIRMEAKALSASQEDLKESQRIAHVGSWRLDIASNEVVWSDELYKMYGFDPALPPPPYTEHQKLFTPESWNRLSKALDKTKETGIPYELELETVQKDGSLGGWMWVHGRAVCDEKGAIIGLMGAAQNITDRKISEMHLQEAVGRFKKVFNSQFDAIFILNSDNPAVILDCNQAALDIFGYDHNELIGQTANMLHVDAEHLKTFRTRLLSSIRGQGHLKQFEFSMKRKDGSIFPSEHSVMKMESDSNEKSGWISVVRDLSKIRDAESALLESEETHRALVNSLPDIVMRFDRDGRHLFVSENVGSVVDLKAAEFIGKTHQELGFPEDQCRFWEEAVQKVCDSGKPFETEFVFDGKSGPVTYNWRLVPERHTSGKVLSVLSISRDITTQRLAEQNYQMLFQEMLDGFALHEIICNADGKPADYRFLAVNPAFERMTGLTAEDIIGRTVLEVIPGIEPHWIDIYGKVALTGEPAFFENYSADLKKHFEVTAFQPLPNRFACIFEDITERKQAEADQERLQARLNQAQKMESIGTLAGGIAHDFNNILFPIVGHTEMLLEDIPHDSPIRNSLNDIYTSALRARDLVHQILSFSRQGKTEVKLMKIQPIIKEALKLIRSTIPTTIEIEQNIQTRCGPVTADPIQIHQIVMNLTTNAFHAMETDGGKLTVTLEEIRMDKKDLIASDMAPGDYACLTVSDTGVGMDKDIADRIFEPFFTTKEKGKGTGMGLSVVHGIVKSINGVIQVFSEPGKGTEFRVYLPLAGSNPGIQEERADTVIPGGCEKILIVDDETAIIEMEKQILGRLGYQVTSCNGSIEALEIFKVRSDQFDLILTDMAMPHMPGDKLAAELIKIRPDIPILICTGFSESLTEENIKPLGIRGLVFKPIIVRDLAQKIRDALK